MRSCLASVVLLAAIGCGGAAADPFGGEDGGSSGGGRGMTGSGGSSPSGTGGTPSQGTGGSNVGGPGCRDEAFCPSGTTREFRAITQADQTSCEDWPICPEGVWAPQSAPPGYAAASVLCGVGHACTICFDRRSGSCDPFVGRCRARVGSAGTTGVVCALDSNTQNLLPVTPVEPATYFRCVGASLVEPICKGQPWPM
jgi:hypothetical protein